MFGESFSGAVEDRCCVATALFIEWILMRNPSAADILETECFSVSRHILNMVATLFEGKMAANRFQPSRVQVLFEFFRCDTVSTGQLHVLDPKTAHLVQRRRDIFGELFAQAVKLKAYRSFEAGA